MFRWLFSKNKKVTIKVTQEDIDQGYPYMNKPWYCPIARALSRKWPDRFIAVTTLYIQISDLQLDAPKIVTDWQRHAFNPDNELNVRPFKFKLEVPRKISKYD